MAAIALVRPRTAPRRVFRPRHPKAFLATDTGVKLVLPYAPREVEHSGLSDEWATIERPGRKPLVVRAADGLAVMSFEVLFARADHTDSVEDLIATLRTIAASSARVTVSLGPSERGVWRLSSVTVRSQLRQPMTNAITRATVSLSFTEAVDSVTKVGPVSGGYAKPKPKPATKAATRRPGPRYYLMRKGDTLWALATRYYGNPYKWPVIAKASGIRNPRTIPIGKRITIPPA